MKTGAFSLFVALNLAALAAGAESVGGGSGSGSSDGEAANEKFFRYQITPRGIKWDFMHENGDIGHRVRNSPVIEGQRLLYMNSARRKYVKIENQLTDFMSNWGSACGPSARSTPIRLNKVSIQRYVMEEKDLPSVTRSLAASRPHSVIVQFDARKTEFDKLSRPGCGNVFAKNRKGRLSSCGVEAWLEEVRYKACETDPRAFVNQQFNLIED